MAKIKHPRAAPVGGPELLEAAYRRVEPELVRLTSEVSLRSSVDVPVAVSLALGALPRVVTLLPQMRRLLSLPPEAEIERLADRARAALHAHAQGAPKTAIEPVEARALLARLRAAAHAHAAYGELDAESVTELPDDETALLPFVALLRAAWPALAGRTPVRDVELERACVFGVSLASGAPHASAADRRGRAVRLFALEYEEIRRAVVYLRHHERDADAYAPPLPRIGDTSVG